MAEWMDGLLVRLEGHWRGQDAPIADLVAPPASAEDMAEWEVRSGLRPPPELRAWWGWHKRMHLPTWDASQRPDDRAYLGVPLDG